MGHIPKKAYVDQTGDTMTGSLKVPTSPTVTDDAEATPKKYVDDRAPKIIVSATAPAAPADPTKVVWMDIS